MRKFKIGDKVAVTAGKNKGKEGDIEKFYQGGRVALVPGLNLYKKHIKAKAAKDGKGGIYEISRPIPLALLQVICPSCKKGTRIGFEFKDGKKVRVCRKCKKVVGVQKTAKK